MHRKEAAAWKDSRKQRTIIKRLRTIPAEKREFLLDLLLFFGIIVLHLHLLTNVLDRNFLYLGGDSTREAWRAATFLRSGKFLYFRSVPYENDWYSLIYVPFLVMVKDPMLCLKVGSIFFTTSTVVMFYFFARKTFGLLGAMALGPLFATSPQLLAHAALSTIDSVIQWISLVLLLDTVQCPWVPFCIMLLAGIFTGLHFFFIFPFMVLVLWKITPWKPRDPRWKLSSALRFSALFLIGFLPLALAQYIGLRNRHFDFTNWVLDLAVKNKMHWTNFASLFGNVWTQLTWSLDTFSIYNAVQKGSHYSSVVFFWIALFLAGVWRKDTIGWSISLAIGLITAGLVQSRTGLGMRHMLAFLPFYWLGIGFVLRRKTNDRIKFLLLSATILLCVKQYAQAKSFVRSDYARRSETAIEGIRFAKEFISDSPRKVVTVLSKDTNLYWEITFLCPEKDVRFVPLSSAVDEGKPMPGTLFLGRSEFIAAQNVYQKQNAYNLGRFLLSPYTTYSILYEKSAN